MTGYSLQGAGQWPQGSPVYPYTLDHLYVDPVAGNDFNNPSGSQARPLRTMQEVSRRLVGYQGRVDVHMRNAVYPLPANGTFLQSRMLNGVVRFVGDDVWDPTLYTVLLATTAQAGTTPASIVVTGPLVVDAFAALTLEVTSGGVKRRRTIRNNDATSIVPCTGVTGAAPGDTVRVLSTNARFAIPVPAGSKAGSISNYVFAQDCPAYNAGSFDAAVGFPGTTNNTGLCFQAVKFLDQRLSPWVASYFGRLPLYLYGVEALSFSAFAMVGTRCFAGTGLDGMFDQTVNGILTSASTDSGWGLSQQNFGPIVEDVTFWGTSATREPLIGAPFVQFVSGEKNLLQFIGGRWPRLGPASPFPQATNAFGNVYLMPSMDAQAIPPLIDFSTSALAFAAVDVPGIGSNLNILAADIRGGTQGGLVVRDGAQCIAATGTLASTVGGSAVAVRRGGRLLVRAPATMGDAIATDWLVEGQPAFNKSVFAAAGVGVLGTDSASLAVSI